MIIFLSLISLTVFFLGGVIWERVRTQWGGVVASVLVRTMGEGGSYFATLVRTY